MNTKKLAGLSLLLAAALILAYLETVFPHLLPVPWLKPGLPNMAVLLTILLAGSREALMITVLQVFSISLLFGSLLTPGFLIALTGAAVSWLAMASVHRTTGAGTVVLSVLGAVFHSLGQVLCAWLLVETTGIFWILWWLLPLSIPVGILTGIPVEMIRSRYLPKSRNLTGNREEKNG